MNDPGSEISIVFNNCISVKGAACHSGYNAQYLRRLLRDGRLTGMKLGQTWLIDKSAKERSLLEPNKAIIDTQAQSRFDPLMTILLGETRNY